VLADLPSAYGGVVPGSQRCMALGLGMGTEKSDCQQQRWPGSNYCYYHDKVLKRMLEPEHHLYPVWPLPPKGYVFIDKESA